MVVISDTSVISNLLLTGHVSLLQRLFGEAIIPPAVLRELTRMAPPVPFHLDEWPWIRVVPVKDEAAVQALTM